MKSHFKISLPLLCLLLLPIAQLRTQPAKLKVSSADSVLSGFVDRGFLRGSVFVEGSDSNLVGAWVTLSDQPVDTTVHTTAFLRSNRTDSVGMYFFDLIPEGQYYLEVDYPGYFPLSETVWIDGHTLSTVDVSLIPDYSRPQLHTTGGVQFECYNKWTGEPIENVDIHFKELHKSFLTDASGVCYVHLLRPTLCHLYISAEGYTDRMEDSVIVKAGTCVLQTTELRELGMSLNDLFCHEDHHKAYPVSMADPGSFGSISGSVFDADAQEFVPYEQIYLAPYGIVAETDSTGRFVFRGLRPGVYCATVRIPGFYRTTEHEITVGSGRTQNIRLTIREIPLFEVPW